LECSFRSPGTLQKAPQTSQSRRHPLLHPSPPAPAAAYLAPPPHPHHPLLRPRPAALQTMPAPTLLSGSHLNQGCNQKHQTAQHGTAGRFRVEVSLKGRACHWQVVTDQPACMQGLRGPRYCKMPVPEASCTETVACRCNSLCVGCWLEARHVWHTCDLLNGCFSLDTAGSADNLC
jgi:hypothetical protein